MFKLHPIKDMPSDFASALHIPPYILYNLIHSWANVFREKVLRNINEGIFSVLYSSEGFSRPNTPVNQLLAFGILAAFLGKSFKDLHRELLTNLEVRYALDLMFYEPENFKDDGSTEYDPKKYVAPFALIDFTRFMRACEQYRVLTGGKIDLIHIALDDLFGKMAIEMEVDGKVVRMDSMMVNSYIKTLSRKELLYVSVALLAKELNDRKMVLPEELQHYLRKDDHNSVLYHTNESYKAVVTRIISEAQKLVEFCTEHKCRKMKAYKVLKRVMDEQLIDDGNGGLRLRTKAEGMGSDILQSPVDLDATFRMKNCTQYRGYIANLVEALGGWGTIVLSYDFQQNTYSDVQFYEDYVKNYVDLDRFDKIPENVDKFPKLSVLMKIAKEADAEKKLRDSILAEQAEQTEQTAKTTEAQTTNTDLVQASADKKGANSRGAALSKVLGETTEKVSMINGPSVPPEILNPMLEAIYAGSLKEAKAAFPLPETDKDFMLILEQAVTAFSELNLIANDGAYQSMDNTILSLMKGIVQVPTNLTGKATPEFLADFVFTLNGEELITCAGGQHPVRCVYTASNKTCSATFEKSQCETCPHFKDCKPRGTRKGFIKRVSQTSKIRACFQRFRSTSQFSIACRFRNGVETLPSLLRRVFDVDHLPVRGLFRAAIFFGLRVAALNFTKLLCGTLRKQTGQRRSLYSYAKPESLLPASASAKPESPLPASAPATPVHSPPDSLPAMHALPSAVLAT